ncbi:unnamed protein product, partial [Prorocentrum cordatum]
RWPDPMSAAFVLRAVALTYDFDAPQTLLNWGLCALAPPAARLQAATCAEPLRAWGAQMGVMLAMAAVQVAILAAMHEQGVSLVWTCMGRGRAATPRARGEGCAAPDARERETVFFPAILCFDPACTDRGARRVVDRRCPHPEPRGGRRDLAAGVAGVLPGTLRRPRRGGARGAGAAAVV